MEMKKNNNNVLSAFMLILALSNVYGEKLRADIPPRGWNSYDSYSWTINDEDFLDNARIQSKKLLKYGYEYVVLDYLWYRKFNFTCSSSISSGFDTIDEWGRPIPDPSRWPSAKYHGFKNISSKVHEMGLKFGIHVMRGLSNQAFDANTPILGQDGKPFMDEGRVWNARDIGLPNQTCKWMPGSFMRINTTLPAAKAFLASLYTQYADWGVDFIKNDCIFGDDLDIGEITTVSEVVRRLDRPILYSLSPGLNATPAMAREINSLVNMYRVSGDDWDEWSHLLSHFDVARDFANEGMVGADGVLGRSWPDLDMLPFGWLTDPGVKKGPHRMSNFTENEQKLQMTLWCMAKSPLMFGGDLKRLDNKTLSIITQPLLLQINAYSHDNMEILNLVTKNGYHIRVWAAHGKPGEHYVSLFNLELHDYVLSTEVVSTFEMFDKNCKFNNVWSGLKSSLRDLHTTIISPHGVILLHVQC